MFKQYLLKLFFRISIFLLFLFIYVFQNEMIDIIISNQVFYFFTPLHIIWFILMLTMILQIIPKTKVSMGCLKQFGYTYQSVEQGIDQTKLYKNVKHMNIKALYVFILWIGFNLIFGVLKLVNIIGDHELILLSLCYYICDLICIMFYCPFQHLIMRNKCCVNCRIFNWGHFMMFTPMLFIKSIFSWSLFITSILILLRWEYVFYKHPERFYVGSNKTLNCSMCQDKMCRVKKPLIIK